MKSSHGRYHERPWVGNRGIGGRTNPVKLDVKRRTLVYGFRASRPVSLLHPGFLRVFPLGLPRGNARKSKNKQNFLDRRCGDAQGGPAKNLVLKP